jgi:hypothetical protein
VVTGTVDRHGQCICSRNNARSYGCHVYAFHYDVCSAFNILFKKQLEDRVQYHLKSFSSFVMSMLLSTHCPPIFRLLIVVHGLFLCVLLATYADHVSANYWNILEY